MTKKEAIKLLQGSILDITEKVRSDILDEYLYTSYKVKVVDAEVLLFWESMKAKIIYPLSTHYML